MHACSSTHLYNKRDLPLPLKSGRAYPVGSSYSLQCIGTRRLRWFAPGHRQRRLQVGGRMCLTQLRMSQTDSLTFEYRVQVVHLWGQFTNVQYLKGLTKLQATNGRISKALYQMLCHLPCTSCGRHHTIVTSLQLRHRTAHSYLKEFDSLPINDGWYCHCGLSISQWQSILSTTP